MKNLIVIKDSLHNSVWLYEALGYASQGDSILLVEDAVSALNNTLSLASFMAKCEAQESTVFALLDDIQMRGVDVDYDSVKLINADQLPDLVLAHQKQVAW